MTTGKPNFDVFQYLGIVKRRKWFLIVPIVVIVGAFFISSYFLPKIYEAKAVILIDEEKVMNPLLDRLAVSTTVAQRMTALKEEILSWPRLFHLVERLELNKDVKDALGLEMLIAKLREDITLRMRADNIVEISFSGPEQKKTQELVSTLCDILIERNLSSQKRATGSALDFIKSQLKNYKEKLDNSEAELRRFKEVYGSGIYEGLDEVTKPGRTLVRINEELGGLEAELVMAKVECTDEHPRVVELNHKIENLKKTRNKYIAQLAKNAGVNPHEYLTIADSLPRQEEELARLTRDKAVNERMYGMFLERLESAEITEHLEDSENRTKFRIIEPARFPIKPVKPNKIKFNLVGILLGSMVGFGFLYFLEYTDSSFKKETDLKDTFNAPVLGSISKIVTQKDIDAQKEVNRRIVILMMVGVVIFSIVIIVVANLKLL